MRLKKIFVSIILIILLVSISNIVLADMPDPSTYRPSEKASGINLDPSELVTENNDEEIIKNRNEAIIQIIVIIAIGAVIYFIPTVIAVKREHINRVGIILINVFLGWTLVGWVGALVWACISTNNNNNNISNGTNKYEELEKLQKLKDNGTITAEEFESEKQKILE